MTTPKTPTYDKSHYSWQPPSSQASKSIIEADDDVPDQNENPGRPGISRRSTFNYQHESEEYKKSQLVDDDDDGDLKDGKVIDEISKNVENSSINDDNGGESGRRGSVTSQPFKPRAQRTKSWDYRDKRGQMQMTMMEEAGTPKDGFSEA